MPKGEACTGAALIGAHGGRSPILVASPIHPVAEAGDQRPPEGSQAERVEEGVAVAGVIGAELSKGPQPTGELLSTVAVLGLACPPRPRGRPVLRRGRCSPGAQPSEDVFAPPPRPRPR
mmetsp:Transcript_80134/g.224923  ORF Transcript_80134/g.224923 Transcript_80134/m.224923 type:complete len:119 (+) Transcript_80134:509-865(+)